MVNLDGARTAVRWGNGDEGGNRRHPIIELALFVLEELPPELGTGRLGRETGHFPPSTSGDADYPFYDQVGVVFGVVGALEDVAVYGVQSSKWVLGPEVLPFQLEDDIQLILRNPSLDPSRTMNCPEDISTRRSRTACPGQLEG